MYKSHLWDIKTKQDIGMFEVLAYEKGIFSNKGDKILIYSASDVVGESSYINTTVSIFEKDPYENYFTKKISFPVEKLINFSFENHDKNIATSHETGEIKIWDTTPQTFLLTDKDCGNFENSQTIYAPLEETFSTQKYLLNFYKEMSSSATSTAYYSNNSKVFISLFKNRYLSLWDTKYGKKLGIFYVSNDHGNTEEIFVNKDETCLLIHDENIRWRIFKDTQELIDYANKIIPRHLSCNERDNYGLISNMECSD